MRKGGWNWLRQKVLSIYTEDDVNMFLLRLQERREEKNNPKWHDMSKKERWDVLEKKVLSLSMMQKFGWFARENGILKGKKRKVENDKFKFI